MHPLSFATRAQVYISLATARQMIVTHRERLARQQKGPGKKWAGEIFPARVLSAQAK
jgi:hypothetical protein